METFWMIIRIIDCIFTIALIYLFISKIKIRLEITDETITKFSKEQKNKYEELKGAVDEFNKE
jgi:hypothetical protein